MRKLSLVLFFIFSTGIASASFLDALVDFGWDVAVEIVADKASDLIDMAIDASSRQTASEREVARSLKRVRKRKERLQPTRKSTPFCTGASGNPMCASIMDALVPSRKLNALYSRRARLSKDHRSGMNWVICCCSSLI